MDTNNLVDGGIDFFSNHTYWAVLVVLVISALIYWKPKGMFRLAMACLALGAVIYVLSFLVDLTSRGIGEAQEFTTTPDIKVE